MDQYVSLSDFISAISSKASLQDLRGLTNVKVNKSVFNEMLQKVAYTDEMQLALNLKADDDTVRQALSNKADSSDVFTIAQTFDVIMKIIGAGTCSTIQKRDALDFGSYPFIWVLDASADPNPDVRSPAFYRWNRDHWDYLGSVGDFIGGGSHGEVDLSEIYRRIEALEETSRDHERRILALENAPYQPPPDVDLSDIERRLTNVENELGLTNSVVTNILNTEFEQEV